MFDCNKDLTPKETAKLATGVSTFVTEGLKSSSETTTANGGVAYSTTNDDFVDQFGKLTAFRAPRSYDEVSIDMRRLCSIDIKTSVKFAMYIRMVSRTTKMTSGQVTETTQSGQGFKNEGILRFLYLGVNHPDIFKANLKLFVSVGSWKDIFRMMEIDIQSNGWDERALDWDFLGKFIIAGLENPETSDLVKKYLPTIKSFKAQTSQHSMAYTIIGKFIASMLFGSKASYSTAYSNYRKLKSSGSAHQWQQLISKKLFNEINFNTVHGRALASMVSGKFLASANLESKYTEWIDAQPAAKFTGYPYELLSPIKTGHYYNARLFKPYQKNTINKQFSTLVELGKSDMLNSDNGFMAVLDTSSSMTSLVPGTNVSAYSVGLSMTLYFSYLLKSKKFGMTWMEFNDSASLNQWTGNNPFDQFANCRNEAYGSTNLSTVSELFVKLLNQGVPEHDFPSGIVCISDGVFNASGCSTAYDALMNKMKEGGFSEEFMKSFKVVFWDIPNSYYGSSKPSPFQSFGEKENLMYLSGLDGSVLKFLFGSEIDSVTKEDKAPKTARELFDATMNQEVLEMVVIK